MTVNGMMLLSKVFLGMMIFFLIVAAVVFFSLDVRKAWRILSGKRASAQPRKKDAFETKIRSNRMNEFISRESKTKQITKQETTSLQTNESIDNQFEGYDSTTILTDNEGETTVLGEAVAETTVLTQQQDNSIDIVMDITFIHTEITL